MATLDVLTLDDAKAALNVNATNVDDVELASWVTAVSQRLDKLVGPVVKRAITDETHDGGHHEVFLEHYPVRSITAMTEYDGITAVALAAETNASRPADGYLPDRYRPDRALLSSRIRRRRAGADAMFAAGRSNVVVSYEAGRFDSTETVGDRYKAAARFLLINLWRSQEDSVGQSAEFDVPMLSFPAFAIPRVVREMLAGEVQEPRVMVA
ncbi:hypothetical protein SAMN05216215_10977 [Saccharopolyspora shandongensis]|uniref:Phage gp6-like head-tail connector protein n=1 Tax=Saccharopolyspora shandongensis TaxID=418495 RepID=A0A1H3TYM4_9PSEU|nr:hypothetical protein [Saccharopolyspora shandongensis]SDZ55188.1 hypothetical protein SAMN05216215_10977 [Saccharopolyspora shandongensis]